MSTVLDDLKLRVGAVLKSELDGFAAVKSITQLTAGASKHTYRVEVSTATGIQCIALRTESSSAKSTELGVAIPMSGEVALLRNAHNQGVPVPQVIAELSDEAGFAGFMMEWCDGESLGHKIVRSEELAKARESLAGQCGVALAKIHSTPWSDIPDLNSLPIVGPAQLVDETWQYYADLDSPIPMIDYVWQWLRSNLPKQSRQTLVHGDFRNGNLMIDRNGLRAVLDWELAHIGDPLRDLGWLCVNSWRFGNSSKPVGGFGEFENLITAYESQAGTVIDRDDLFFWQVFGSFWWSITTLLMAQSWRSGANSSLERTVIGRRSSEAQLDCANLLFEETARLSSDPHSYEHQQLPSALEMVQGVADFLGSEAMSGLPSHDKFMAKVAANSLGIVQRELKLGEQAAAIEQVGLAELLGRNGSLSELRTVLVEKIRNNEMFEQDDLHEHLLQTVVAQVQIDQPSYSGLGRHTST